MEVDTSSPLISGTKRKDTHSQNGRDVDGKRLKTDIVAGVESQQENVITEEESKLLDADYWLSIDRGLRGKRITQSDRDYKKHFYQYSLVVISEAYAVVRKTTSGIIEVLTDEFSMIVLFHFGFCLRRFQEFSRSLREMRTHLSEQHNKLDGSSADVHADTEGAVPLNSSMGHLNSSAKPEELEKSGKGRCLCSLTRIKDTANLSHTQILSSVEKFIWEVEGIIKLQMIPQNTELNQFSIKIHNILLILKEILARMGINPEASESSKKDMETKVADNIGGVTAAENLCIQCGNNLNPMIDSEVLKAEQEVLSITEDGETRLRSFIDNHFSTFLDEYAAKGLVKRDTGYAELMGLVEAGVSHLMTGIKQEECLLVEMIEAVYDSFGCDTVEFKRVFDCDERRMKMTKEIECDAYNFSRYMSHSTKELDMAFRNIIDLINPVEKWSVWRPSNHRYHEGF